MTLVKLGGRTRRLPPAREDAKLTWKMATFAIVGVSLAFAKEELTTSVTQETVIRLLCMTGIGEAEAIDLASRPRPALSPEETSL
ncbi:hypothetical protein [Mesorhizobium sp. M0047]|uniref:hypothetical protein n=1 Tax=unclassified Mesorhizobium TaxID=325217 RepID=UPI003335E71E